MYKKFISYFTAFIIVAILVASCHKKTLKFSDCSEKTINPDCICTKIYKPVCGCNGKTYGNECEARCHNINKFIEGECLK